MNNARPFSMINRTHHGMEKSSERLVISSVPCLSESQPATGEAVPTSSEFDEIESNKPYPRN